ncbi:undecaprenyl-diphosphatase [Jeotgalibacillus alimentarius]|uniref:Undecaprenyl-diphosphatase n=2 Tax=Jeotgalibacillus alimentarius TaxID=135826 RepID=A0A0C2VC30_9BACL|nr:undecaprenyl-diphosphatase [Jeotgalibacillus alimentarius]
MTTIAIMLFVTGIALWLIKNIRGSKDEGDITTKDSFLVGVGQSLALMPGISRSGATIISSVAVGMNRDTALRFSFLLYIPVSLGGVVLSLSDFINEPDKSELMIPYLLAFVSTLLMTYVAMKWFISMMKSGKLYYFSYYCFVMGLILLIFF